jgi:hypothetical protein
MRNMSFSATTAQFRARTKTVTRRMGWRFLKPGDLVCGIVKGRGLKKGERVERLGTIRVLDVRREPLVALGLEHNEARYGYDEVAREGFPDLSPWEFIDMSCSLNGCRPEDMVTRIEFEYVAEAGR